MTDAAPTKPRKTYSNRMPRPNCPVCGTPVRKARAKYCNRACSAVAMRGSTRTPRVSDPIAHIRERCTVTGSGCWEWQRSRNAAGYGEVSLSDYLHVSKLIHVLTYTILVGPVPEGLELDHLCRNRACCNPEHLEAVTHAVNIERGKWEERKREWFKQQTHCRNGHEYTFENTHIRTDGRRRCRTCQREWAARHKVASS